MGFLDKAKKFARSNPDKVESASTTIGDTFDKRTGGKYADHTDKAQAKTADYLRDDRDEPPAADQPPADEHPPA